MKKFLFLLMLLLLAGFAGVTFTPPAAAAQSTVAADVKVVLYVTDWCGYCRKTKAFFDARGIPYVEHDIEKDAQADKEFERLGGRGVPLVIIDDTVIRGYSEEAMKTALGL